jgi:hypothetical protein
MSYNYLWEHRKIDGVWHRRALLGAKRPWQKLEVSRVALPQPKWARDRNWQGPTYTNKWDWKKV